MTADDRRDGLADGPAGDLAALEVRLLADALAAAGKVAARLAWSRRRVAGLMPLAAEAVTGLSDEDEERIDALLLRFNSLTAMIQDHVVRALLRVEEEEIKDRSRKDQRLLVEKLGALRPHLGFATLAELETASRTTTRTIRVGRLPSATRCSPGRTTSWRRMTASWPTPTARSSRGCSG